MGLELRFLLDWNYAAKDHLFSNPRYMAGFAPAARDNCYMQIIYSGPDTSLEPIRDNYIRLIHKAKEKSIFRRRILFRTSPCFPPCLWRFIPAWR